MTKYLGRLLIRMVTAGKIMHTVINELKTIWDMSQLA